ncbi:phage tail protein [Actinosynnema pretiosum]|uniref:Phage tail protein n=1 Tax=Actinosynnema pretiosum TaxID=42197 RepID=A0A290Z601_9PSEU|nr:phage tail protein [Actinosynnema pretiosum]ATE54414.1 phage tail protein [Actinosynnema pretiosum]
MRAALPELPSSHPIGALLPALYAEDGFAQRFTGGLDAVLSAVLSTVDNITAYLDPDLAPEDFLAWLSEWVAAEVDPRWPLELRRAAVSRAVELHAKRGTVAGLVERVELSLGVRVEVLDGPGASWSPEPDATIPAGPDGPVVVRVRPGVAAVDRERVEELVESLCPVHLRCVVEVLDGEPGSDGERGGEAG